MKKIILIITVLFIVSINSFAGNKTTLTGQVTDQKTGEAMPGVLIYFPDLETGTSTDASGHYHIEDLPKTKVLVKLSFIGYKTYVEHIDLAVTNTKDFALKESAVELNTVVVISLSNSSEKNRSPNPIETMHSIQLKRLSSTNIIDAIASNPGISEVTTGPGISKPVIRGLGYNRVVVVNDGIRQEGQQWGDEHGTEVDGYSVNRVEIIKGPASLSYGSDAMAGVINMLPAPTLQEGKIKGSVLANYQSNNGLLGGSFHIAGNQKGLVWNLRYSKRMAHAYKNKYDGYVFNSGFNEDNLSARIGLNKSWGYAHLSFSAYSLTPGIIEGDRDSATGQFTKPVALNDSTEGNIIADNNDFMSYTPVTPYQKVRHYTLVSNNRFNIGNGNLKTTVGWQQDRRQEFEDILKKDQVGLYFFMNAINYNLHYSLPEKKNWNVSFGLNGMYQQSENKGTEYLIPDYSLFDIGAFAIVKKKIGNLNLRGGLRYDTRAEQGYDLWLDADGKKTNEHNSSSFHQFTQFNSDFKAISGSIGAAYQISEKVYTKLNLSKGFRAPNIAELSANGVHEGSFKYIIGNPDLEAEKSLQLDYAIGLNSDHITAEADLFYNHINDFIYQQKLNGISGIDSLTQGYETFKYTSGNAHLYGGEISIDIHPHPWDWLHFKNSFAIVQSIQTNQPDSMKYLPFTPAPKFSSTLRADKKKIGKHLTNAYVKVGLDHYFNQNHFYSAFGTETATPGYTLLDFGIGTDVVSDSQTLFSIYISVKNLLDVAYQNHLSRLKYADINQVTGRTGVFNMGRNISIKLIIPFDIKK